MYRAEDLGADDDAFLHRFPVEVALLNHGPRGRLVFDALSVVFLAKRSLDKGLRRRRGGSPPGPEAIRRSNSSGSFLVASLPPVSSIPVLRPPFPFIRALLFIS